jgi:quinol monooxygenase YgiN
MPTLHIEHQIHDFASWKAAFDRDPAGRQQSGVLRYRVARPVDDPAYVMIDLDFASADEAVTFLTAMREVWRSPQAAPALRGSPQARIVELVECKEY